MAASQAVTVPIEPLGHPTGLRIIGVRTPMSATAPLHLWEDDSSRQPSGESHADLTSSSSCSCCNSTQRSVSPPPDTTCDIVAAADEKKLIDEHQMHAALDKKKPTEHHHHSLIDEAPHNDLDLEIMRNHAPPAIVASAAAPDHMSAAAMAHRSLQLMMPMTPTEIEKAGLPPGKSTFFQATLNCVSMLYGLGILSSPFAVAKAGWMGAIISLLVSTAYAYSAYLMAKCVKHNPKCATYQDVASMAFGKRIRKLIAALFYIEITGTLVGYCISVGDNLAYIFPNSSLSLPGLSGRNFMIFVASLIMLPSVWLRDLSALSFTSMWCIASTILLLIAVMLAATVNHIGFTHPIPFLRIQGVPVAAGLYAFSYGGTSVFPSIYMSMKEPTKFTKALVVSFVIATSSIAGLGIVGAYMFGDHTASQITLSMPIHFITTKIILWMTVITPMFKFALQLSPITTALETHLYRRCKTSKNAMLYGMSTLMRSMVLASIAIFSMVFPYFEYIVALVGSSMTIAICMIFPCVFYMKLFWGQLKMKTIILISLLVIVGVIVGACGTIVSVQGLINKRRS